MNPAHATILEWIDAQAPAMTRRLIDWASINTGSTNKEGLAHFATIVRDELAHLGAQIHHLSPAVSATKRHSAANRVFLCIHMDTVYADDDPFKFCTQLNENTLQGPGVADAKGGLVVLLTALAAFEQSPLAQNLGWEVLINPDEEIGSKHSAPLLKAAAARNRIGLLKEALVKAVPRTQFS